MKHRTKQIKQSEIVSIKKKTKLVAQCEPFQLCFKSQRKLLLTRPDMARITCYCLLSCHCIQSLHKALIILVTIIINNKYE
jgi:hypothetical protein